MNYLFVLVFTTLLLCCFHSCSSSLEMILTNESLDSVIPQFEVEAVIVEIPKNVADAQELMSILEPEVTDNILKDGFEMDIVALYHINDRIHRVVAIIGTSFMPLYINVSFVNMVMMLENALNVYFFSGRSDVERNQFLGACWNHSMLGITRMIHQEIMKGDSVLPLIKTGVTVNQLGDLLILSNLAILIFIKASILGHTCLGTLSENEAILQNFSAVYRNKSRHDLSEMVNILKMEFLSLDDQINSIPDIKDYVANYAYEHQDQSHQDFVDAVYKDLTEKYFWRNWLVVSFRQPQKFESVHFIKVNSDYSFYIDKGYNRGIFVSSPDIAHDDAFTKNIDVCFARSLGTQACGKYLFLCPCWHHVNEFLDCHGSMDLKGVACLQDSLNMKFKGGPSGYKVYSLKMSQTYLGVQVNKTLMAVMKHDFVVVL